MLRPRRSLEIAVLLAATLWLPARETAAQSQAKVPTKNLATTTQKSKRPVSKSAPIAEAPPPAPQTLEQQPPAPPQVTYNDGQLTINSTNATLAQVLRSVQTQTGAAIEIPNGAGSERVVATLGPGKPQTVLASLLNGSRFNYVILGVPDSPGTVQKVILLAKSNSSTSSDVPGITAQNVRPPQPQPGSESPEDEYPPNEPEVENPNPVQPGLPVVPGNENLAPDSNQPGNRTPEQMLQELQRMQQQQQQMQQQLNPVNQQPFIAPNQPPQQAQPPNELPQPQ